MEVLLCIELGIKTLGVGAGDYFGHKSLKCADHVFDDQQLNENSYLTSSYLLKQEGWFKYTSQLPDIRVSTVKTYLLNSKAHEFTSTSFRHYKLSRASTSQCKSHAGYSRNASCRLDDLHLYY